MSSQHTPGLMASSTACTAASTAWYTILCPGENLPETGKLVVMSAP